jgi:hypothetical protein
MAKTPRKYGSQGLFSPQLIIPSHICPRHGLDNNLKATLYKTFVRPVFTYAAAMWSYTAPTHIQKLQRVQNKFIRSAFKPERGTLYKPLLPLAEKHGICPIDDYIQSMTQQFYSSISTQNCTNLLMRSLGRYNSETLRFKYTQELPKHRLL